MSWFGIDCFSNANNNSAKLHRGRGKYADFIPPQTALFRESDENTKFVREKYEGLRFNSLEQCINYTFMEKSFLIQAFSHMSCYKNRSTDCYQRLEFLGDAILDFLIIAHLYACDEELDPSRLTSIKSALVNNNTFALLAVRFNLHKYLLHFEQKLESAIKQYIDLQEEDIKRMLEVCPCATYDRPLLLLHIVCTCICVFVCVFAHKYSLVHVCVCVRTCTCTCVCLSVLVSLPYYCLGMRFQLSKTESSIYEQYQVWQWKAANKGQEMQQLGRMKDRRFCYVLMNIQNPDCVICNFLYLLLIMDADM